MRTKITIPFLWIASVVGAMALSVVLLTSLITIDRENSDTEINVTVADGFEQDDGGWWICADAVGLGSGSRRPFVVRIKRLRAEWLPIEILQSSKDRVLVKNNELKSDDLLILNPQKVPSSRAVNVANGLNDESLIRITIDAGISAVAAEDLDECTRFIAADYRDASGLNFQLLRLLLERAFEEFDEPRIEVVDAPAIRIAGDEATIYARVQVEASRGGRRNYLLGDRGSPNQLLVFMEKSSRGWKVSNIQGLNPLGLGERFLKLLAAEVGLTLSESELRDKKEACMPCRNRMSERFGPRP